MSIVPALEAIAFTARICAPTVVDSALGRVKMDQCDARLAWWSRRIVEAAEIELSVQGAQHAAGDEAFVVMSNHQSHYDVPVLFCSVPGRLRMIAKKELFRIPLFGPAMLAAGFIELDRQDRSKAAASLEDSGRMLGEGVRVWIAPEGTRSKTGELGSFKSGGFRLAIQSKARILPVTIDGTRGVLPRGAASVRRGQRVRVTVHPPIDATAYGIEKRKQLMQDVASVIRSALHPS